MSKRNTNDLANTPHAPGERRGAHRTPATDMVCAVTELGLQGNDQGFGIVIDRSSGGLRIWTPSNFNGPQSVVLQINAGEQIFRIPATVRWKCASNRGGREVGLGFVGAVPERRALEDKIDELDWAGGPD